MEFPQSPRVKEAKVWTGVLNTLEELKIKMEAQRSAHGHLLRSQSLFAKGDYEGALEENKEVLSRYANTSPGDEALFNMGLIYAHMKDYQKALSSFKRFVKNFPQGPRIEEAKIWIEVLNAIEETKQVDIEIEEKKKELIR